ncbi:MAG: hypothetical protein GY838_01365 [bacterium]|nr:hypothetical protein [bacterium]
MARLLTAILLLTLATAASAQTTDLLISEYVEGSGYYKALEIFNGTDRNIDLSAYAIERYANGETTPTIIALDAVVLGPGDLHVLAHTQFPLSELADQFSMDMNFDGNDALVLALGGVPVDRIGRVGEYPGDYWSCDLGTTQNHTLVRLPGVCAGEESPAAVFDPCAGWSFLPSDTVSGLGDHTSDCGTVDAPDLSWSDLKASFR